MIDWEAYDRGEDIPVTGPAEIERLAGLTPERRLLENDRRLAELRRLRGERR